MKQDRRIQKTEHLFQKALLELLKSKNVTEITITELSEAANVYRGTFYLHYKDIKELLFSIEKEMIEKLECICCVNSMDTFHMVPYSALLEIFHYLDEHKHIMMVFLGKDTYFMSEMRRILTLYSAEILKRRYKNASQDEYDFTCGYIVEGMIFIFKEWVFCEKDWALEEVAVQLQRVVLHGADALCNGKECEV